MNIVCEVPVTFAADKLKGVGRMRGQVCCDDVSCDGTTHPAGSLVLLGFAGVRTAAGWCQGVYRFRRVQPVDSERNQFVLADLPGGVAVQDACEAACEPAGVCSPGRTLDAIP